MDQHSRELARQSAEYLGEHLAPHYKQIRNDFLAALAISGASLESMRGETETGMNNREIITKFTDFLPGITFGAVNTPDNSMFSERIDEIVISQHSSVFCSFSDPRYLGNETVAPFYVVGKDRTKQHLLLASPKIDVLPKELNRGLLMTWKNFATEHKNTYQDKLVIAHPVIKKSKTRWGSNKHELERKKYFDEISIHLNVSEALWDNETPDNVLRMFDRQSSGIMRLNANSPGSFALKGYILSAPFSYLSDNQMLKFDVIERLNQLAVTFGKHHELTSLLHHGPED